MGKGVTASLLLVGSPGELSEERDLNVEKIDVTQIVTSLRTQLLIRVGWSQVPPQVFRNNSFPGS